MPIINIELTAADDIKTENYTFASTGDELQTKILLREEDLETLKKMNAVEEIQNFLSEKLEQILMVRKDHSYVGVKKEKVNPTGEWSEEGAKKNAIMRRQ